MPVACAHALLLLGAQSGGALPQTALLAHFSIDKSNVSRLVARLVEMGLVKCRADASDRRGKSIALTPKGARMGRKLELASKDRFARLMGGIPAAKRAPVVAALAELVEALSRLETGATRDHQAARSRPARRSPPMSRKNDRKPEVKRA